MLFDWNRTICLAEARDLQLEAPVFFEGGGLWACVVSSGTCRAGTAEAGAATDNSGTAPFDEKSSASSGRAAQDETVAAPTDGTPAQAERVGVVPTDKAIGDGRSSFEPAAEARAAGAGTLVLGGGPFVLCGQPRCHLLAVRLAGQAAESFLAALPEGLFFAQGSTCPAAAELLTQLADAADTPGRDSAQSQLAFSLLCELSAADAEGSALPPLIAEAVSVIRQSYAQLYGVEELSEQMNVSKSHLVRSFSAAMGVSPGKYLTHVRIEAVKRLLLHREYSLEVIASLCGFSGANYLCRVFRRETGRSPAEWRAFAMQRSAAGLTPVESARERELYV